MNNIHNFYKYKFRNHKNSENKRIRYKYRDMI